MNADHFAEHKSTLARLAHALVDAVPKLGAMLSKLPPDLDPYFQQLHQKLFVKQSA